MAVNEGIWKIPEKLLLTLTLRQGCRMLLWRIIGFRNSRGWRE